MESIIDPMRLSDMEHYISLKKWQNMRSVHKMTRVRYDKRTGKESREVTYFISSPTDPETVFNYCCPIKVEMGISRGLFR